MRAPSALPFSMACAEHFRHIASEFTQIREKKPPTSITPGDDSYGSEGTDVGRRDPAFLTSLRYFFSFFSHFLEALTICFDVIFMLMSSSWRETRWPMVPFGGSRRVRKKSAGLVLSVEHFCSVWRRRVSLGVVALAQTQQSRLFSEVGGRRPAVWEPGKLFCI